MRFAFIWKRLYHIFLFKVRRGGDCECKLGSWLVKKIYNSQACCLLIHRYYYKQQCQYEGGKFITALFNLLSWIVKQVSIFIKKNCTTPFLQKIGYNVSLNHCIWYTCPTHYISQRTIGGPLCLVILSCLFHGLSPPNQIALASSCIKYSQKI